MAPQTSPIVHLSASASFTGWRSGSGGRSRKRCGSAPVAGALPGRYIRRCGRYAAFHLFNRGRQGLSRLGGHMLIVSPRARALATAVVAVAAYACVPAPALGAPIPGTDVTYTLDADFDQGQLASVNHDAPNNDQLQLNRSQAFFPFVNVAASARGTIVRVDVNTGADRRRVAVCARRPLPQPLAHDRRQVRQRLVHQPRRGQCGQRRRKRLRRACRGDPRRHASPTPTARRTSTATTSSGRSPTTPARTATATA